MSDETQARCSLCTMPAAERICLNLKGRGAGGCPTLVNEDILETAKDSYLAEDVYEFARQASIQEGSCYEGRDKTPPTLHPTKTRVQEICEFAHRMEYSRLGLAYCIGLSAEAVLLDRILEAQGFEVVSVCCKAGCVPKEYIGLANDEKIFVDRHESMCNPIGQAKILNNGKTHFNIALGLCVGHDSLLFKYAEALTTVLAAKDRVTGHNPLGPLYTSGSYHRRLRRKGF